MATDALSFADWSALCDFARELNEYVPAERVKAPAAAPSDAKGDRPGDEFNRRGSWAEVLGPAGWTVDRAAGEVTYWRRPDKARGCSATTGKCSSDTGGDLLYVFSTNAAPFEPDHAYSKFSAYAILHHGGDFGAAAKTLRANGYGPTVGGTDPVFGPPAGGDGPPDDGVAPDPDFATNADLERFDLGVKWVWEGWLQRGVVNLFAAEGGMGKTRVMGDLCRRVHLRGEWPDTTPAFDWPHEWLVMWVAGDRNHGELLELSRGFGFGDRICYSGSKADPLGGVTLNTAADFTALYRKLKAARPLFLVVDTAGGATGLNMARQEEARQLFSPLSDMAARLNLCVVVITHLNATKNVLGKRAEERVRVYLRMTAANKEPETPRRLEVMKSNSLFPKPLGVKLETVGCDYSGPVPPAPEDGPAGVSRDDPERGPPTAVRDCIDWLADLLANRPKRVSEVRREAENRGTSSKTLYKAKETMGLKETEDSQGYKWWSLA